MLYQDILDKSNTKNGCALLKDLVLLMLGILNLLEIISCSEVKLCNELKTSFFKIGEVDYICQVELCLTLMLFGLDFSHI